MVRYCNQRLVTYSQPFSLIGNSTGCHGLTGSYLMRHQKIPVTVNTHGYRVTLVFSQSNGIIHIRQHQVIPVVGSGTDVVKAVIVKLR